LAFTILKGTRRVNARTAERAVRRVIGS